MSLDVRDEDAPPIEDVDALVSIFREAEVPPDATRVGMEHEKFGLLTEDLRPLPYSGPVSIEAVFRILVERFGFEPYYEGEKVVALTHDGTHVSLEPGGQLELSGAVLADNHETCRELTLHRELVHAVGEELGIVWLGLGHTPFARRDEIAWVPKARYAIMRRYLPTRGRRALDMMLRTGTVQANFDYCSERDMARKMRVAMGAAPIVAALYANSPLVEGRLSGWASERQRIWREVDPDRTGLLDFVFREDFGYRDWVEWALDVPMFFIRRGGRYLDVVTGMPFRRFLEEGAAGHRASLTDWHDHLTTLFPEARLKGFIEVRSADCCDREMNCALPALWKGLLYSEEALDAAWALVQEWTMEQRRRALLAAAKDGLSARFPHGPAHEYAEALVAISRRGLARQARLDANGRDETHYLDPLEAVVRRRRAPGQQLAEAWNDGLAHDPRKLVEACRF